jgi:mono/diheme cytochrome c family protein
MKQPIIPFIIGSCLLASASAQEKTNKIDPEILKRGAAVYARTCLACHQPTGKGIPNVFPPLDGSDWVSADPSLAIKIVIKGLQGPIKVNGQNFATMMPPVMPALNDQEIADVLSYIHVSWANDLPAVTPEQVQKVREEIKDRTTPFTAADLGR